MTDFKIEDKQKILANTECFLLDMDGTIYLGEKLIKGVNNFINLLKKRNKDFVLLTNNSSRNRNSYHQKLKHLGIDIPLSRIITSGEVTANYIKSEQETASVYVVGTEKLKDDFRRFGLQVVEDKKVSPDYVVVGFDTSLTYQKLWRAHEYIKEGINYLATNPDRVCPLEDGATKPDCGAIIELLKTSTGQEPRVIGKPNTLMVDYVAQKFEIDSRKMAMAGDRLYTDIKTAKNSNITSILVLSGETKQEDLTSISLQPDFVFSSLAEIQELI